MFPEVGVPHWKIVFSGKFQKKCQLKTFYIYVTITLGEYGGECKKLTEKCEKSSGNSWKRDQRTWYVKCEVIIKRVFRSTGV